jgi:tRNA (guanine-N(7)-)-methyltransferase subunit TRM82
MLTPRRFVSAIHIPREPAAHGILVSGGGDPVLKVWDWRMGRRLYDVSIEDTVRPFISVRRARPQRGYDSDGERKPPSRRWLARQRRREAKAASGAATPAEGDVGSTPEVEEVEVEGYEGGGGAEGGIEDESGDEATPTPEMEERPLVLVVLKIDTLKVAGRVVVVFSAVGCAHRLGIPIAYDPADGTFRPVRRRCSGLCYLKTLP